MLEYWSLVVFTILGQSAAGLMLLIALSRRETTSAVRITRIAAIILIAAALASLAHLSDPLVSYYTITNAGTSWLSREILFCGLFGASMLLWIFVRRRPLLWLSGALGVAFVYVMSRVYTIPTEPAWNSPFTFWNFLSTSVLLGGSLLLVLDELAAGCRAGAARRVLLGQGPLAVILAMGFRLVFLLLERTYPEHGDLMPQALSLVLLVAGAGLGMPVLARRAARQAVSRHAAANAENSAAYNGKSACCLCAGTIVATLLIWTAEICGRVLFYLSYTWFGM